MTVANQTARTSAVGTNVAGQVVPFTFPINASGDITVKTRVTATGVEATLTETTDYAVTISGNTGGSIELVSALATTSEVFIIRNTPRTQALELEQGGSFNAERLEEAFDKLCREVNDLKDQLDRCLHAPDTDATGTDLEIPNSVDRASMTLTFDASGDPTATAAATTTVSFSVWGEAFVALANAAAARTNLGLAIGTNVQAYDADLTTLGGLAKTDGNFIVGNGSAWVAESGATARTSLGAAAAADVPETDRILTYDGDVITYEGNVLTYGQT